MDNEHVTEEHHYHPDPAGLYDITGESVWLPVNHRQLRDLLGRVLTHLDAMGLPERAHKAARTLLTQETWRWWDEVYRNARTSYEGCLAPVICPGVVGSHPAPNRWGWKSEQEWLDAMASPEPAARSKAYGKDE